MSLSTVLSFDLTGFMGTDAGQSPSSLDDTAATSWSISQGHRSMETLLPCVFSVFICASPLPSFFGRGGSQTNKNTHLFFLRDSQNLIYQNCSNLPQINQILKGVPFGLNPAKIINYFLFNFIYLSLKGTLSLKGGIR